MHRRRPGCEVSKYGGGVEAAWSADQRCKVSKYGRGVNKTSALVSQKPMFKNRHVKLPLLYDGFFFCRCKKFLTYHQNAIFGLLV